MSALTLPLEPYRHSLTGHGPVPRFDPADGGANARLLILLETPGASAPAIVTRDNPTGTARNLARFLDDATIPRDDTLLWNAVPWIVHTPGAGNRPLRRAEIAAGLATLPPLLHLLPHLKAVVLAGRVAAQAAPVIARERPDLAVLHMPHPSPTYVCTSPAVPRRIAATLADAARLLATA